MTAPLAGEPDVRSDQQLRVVLARWLTRGGTYPNLAVGTGVATFALTFTLAEPDASYGVLITPQWGTTAWVTNKTTTGCTLNFGTVSPVGGTVDVAIFRTEAA